MLEISPLVEVVSPIYDLKKRKTNFVVKNCRVLTGLEVQMTIFNSAYKKWVYQGGKNKLH